MQILFDYPPPIKAFAEGWRDNAEMFISGLWHDPEKGHRAAIDARLGPESFPEPWLWTLARLLAACGIKGYDPDPDPDPKTDPDGVAFIGRALRDLGEHVEGPDLARVKWRHCSAVSVERYALLLADYSRRRVLHDRLGLLQQATLDECEPLGRVTARVLSVIEALQTDGSAMPAPPEIKRPPAIIMRPSIARTQRTSQQHNRRYSRVRVVR